MIDKDRIAAACLAADLSALAGLEQWALDHGLDVEAVMWACNQRALRAGMILSGIDPTTLDQWRGTRVKLTPETDAMMPILSSIWTDGFAVGLLIGLGDKDPR